VLEDYLQIAMVVGLVCVVCFGSVDCLVSFVGGVGGVNNYMPVDLHWCEIRIINLTDLLFTVEIKISGD